MSDSITKSRIARQLTLRRAEITAHSASVVAWSLTALLVGSGHADEANPFSAFLIAQSSPQAWALVTPLLIGGLFAGLRWVRDNDDPQAAVVSAWAVAAILTADAGGNLLGTAVVGVPSVQLAEFGGFVAGLVAIAGLCVLRPSPTLVFRAASTMRQRLSVRGGRQIAMALLLVTAIPAGAVVLGTQPTSTSQSGLATAQSTAADGVIYTASRDETVKAVDSETGDEIWSFSGHNATINTVTVSKDGSTVYSFADNGIVRAVDAETGQQVWVHDSASENAYSSMAVSPDGSTVYLGVSYDGIIRAIDTETGDQIWSFGGFSEAVYHIEVGPDGTIYAGGQDNTVRAVDPTSGTQEWSFDGHSDVVGGVSVSPDGSTAYTSSSDSTVRAIDTETGQEKWVYDGHSDTVSDVTLSPDNSTIFTASGGSDNTVRAINTSTGSMEWSFDGFGTSVRTVAAYPDESAVFAGSAANDGSTALRAIDQQTGEQIWSSSIHDADVFDISASYPFGSATAADLNGTVRDTTGQPVENATVEVYGVNRSALSANPSKLNTTAEELLDEARNATPSTWKPDRTLTGSDALFSDASTAYVAAHPKGDWGLTGYLDSPQLGNPRVQLPAGEEIALSVWDPAAGGLVQDGVNGDLPGGVDDDTDIVVKSIDHTGDTVNSRTIETDTTYDVGGLGSSHDLATTTLPAGFYVVHPEGSPETAYTIVVGDPDEIAQTIRSDLKNEADQLTRQAKRVRDRLDRDVLKRYTATTDANGSWSVDVPDTVSRVSVQAYKAPPGLTTDPRNATLQDIREFYQVTNYNGSYVMPTSGGVHAVPSKNVEVRVVEAESPQFPGLNEFQNRTEQFRSMLQNLSYSDLPSTLQQRLDSIDRADLEETATRLERLTDQNSELESRVEELTNRDLGEITVNTSSDEQLREQIQAQQQAISELRSTIETSDSAAEVVNSTDGTSEQLVTSSATFAEELTREQVRVIAQFPNGTTREVPEEYVSIDQSAGALVGMGGTSVSVEDYPLATDGPGQIQFAYQAVTEDGVGKTSTTVDNPASSSQIGLDAISLSSLRPGPDEQVDVSLIGDDETQITEINAASVVGPNGGELNTSTDAKTATFQTSGQGRYYIELDFQTASGAEGTLTHRIKAASVDQSMPPGVRLKDSVFGTLAVVGDGFEAGSASVSNGGQTVDVTAQIPGNDEDGNDDEAPASMHLYAHALSMPPEATLNVDVVRGDAEESIQRNVEITAHLPALSSETPTLYRGEDALPRSGEGQIGSVSTSDDETTITTVTDASGSVSIETNNNPGRLDRFDWWWDRNAPSFSLGILQGTTPTIPFPTVDIGTMTLAGPAAGPAASASTPAAPV